MGNCVNDKNELEKSRESVLCFRGLRVSAWALGGGWRISRLAASPQTGRRSQTSARLASPATKIKQILWDKQIFENWIKHALPGLNMHKNCFVKVFFKRIYNFFYPSRAMRTNTFSKPHCFNMTDNWYKIRTTDCVSAFCREKKYSLPSKLVILQHYQFQKGFFWEPNFVHTVQTNIIRHNSSSGSAMN